MIVTALRGVILQKMREHLRARKIVDRDNLIPLGRKHLTKRQTTDTSKPVDCYFYCHKTQPPKINFVPFGNSHLSENFCI